jgi:F-type H+-transporting ATPase subunit delta
MSTRASAARYARALFDVATAESNPELVERDLSAFADLMTAHEDVRRALVNPAVPAANKQTLVEQLTDRLRPAAPVRKLLLLLAERGRFEIFDDLLDVYRERLMEHLHVIKADVTTAEPLSADQASQLRQRLAAATGRTVTLTTRVDPGIIGGVVTRIGSTVYDGSVATQLAALKQRLVAQR